MKKYRKKPVVVEAMQFTNNGEEIVAWSRREGDGEIDLTRWPTVLRISTLEGDMQAHVGDWIIKGFEDEFYPCKPWIFEATYEAVDD